MLAKPQNKWEQRRILKTAENSETAVFQYFQPQAGVQIISNGVKRGGMARDKSNDRINSLGKMSKTQFDKFKKKKNLINFQQDDERKEPKNDPPQKERSFGYSKSKRPKTMINKKKNKQGLLDYQPKTYIREPLFQSNTKEPPGKIDLVSKDLFEDLIGNGKEESLDESLRDFVETELNKELFLPSRVPYYSTNLNIVSPSFRNFTDQDYAPSNTIQRAPVLPKKAIQRATQMPIMTNFRSTQSEFRTSTSSSIRARKTGQKFYKPSRTPSLNAPRQKRTTFYHLYYNY